jgi:hypothetical protein
MILSIISIATRYIVFGLFFLKLLSESLLSNIINIQKKKIAGI